MAWHWRWCLILASLLLNAPVHAFDSLVVDLSHHTVSITTGFAGTDVLLFGAVDDAETEGDVIVVMRGPDHDEIVRRKDRQMGLWINSQSAIIHNVPSFYQIAASRPLDRIANPQLLQDYRIGMDHLRLKTDGEDPVKTEFTDALIHLKQRAGLYSPAVQPIGFLDDRLFRTDIHIPSNVPVGNYRIDVFHVTAGRLVDIKTTSLVVSKIGLGAAIFDFAHHYGALYGLAAISLAALAGWVAALAFKR